LDLALWWPFKRKTAVSPPMLAYSLQQAVRELPVENLN